MRFTQFDSIFGAYEWSGTLDSHNKRLGYRAFVDFDYSNFSDAELQFLTKTVNALYFETEIDEFGKEYASEFVIKAHPLEHRRWYWVDWALNFSPTDTEILKSINGQSDIRDHPLAKEQVDILTTQLSDVIGVGNPLFFWPDFDLIVKRMAEVNNPNLLNCSNVFNSVLGLADYLLMSNESHSVFQGPTTGNISERGVLLTIATALAREYLQLSKVNQFDPFLYNMIGSSASRQHPLYLLWLAAHEDKNYRKIANEKYGIFVTKSNSGLPTIKVTPQYRNLLLQFENQRPGLQQSDILPGTEQIETPFSNKRGLPKPGILEKMFYLRLFHGISASPEQLYSEKFGYPLDRYNTITKERIPATRIENMDEVFKKKYPFRMRYENQFLLPEPFCKKNEKQTNFSLNDLPKIVKFEKPNFHFIAGGKAPTKVINPSSRFTVEYQNENKNYWYYGLWCHPGDEKSSNRKYYPTGFSLSNYEVYDTTQSPQNYMANYTSFGKKSDSSENNNINNVTYWFDSNDTVSDGIDNITTTGVKMTQNGPRGGIPTNYLSILRLEAEIKGRKLIKEAENFAKVIRDGVTSPNKEILPVVYQLDGKYASTTKIYNDKAKKITVENELFVSASLNQIKKYETKGKVITETPITNPALIAYISNIKHISDTHPHFKYHERVWNKEGTGVYPKIGDPFSPSTWVNFFSGNHTLNRAFPEKVFESDFPASTFIPSETDDLCSPNKKMMYPRTLIEPDFTAILMESWLDSHSSDVKQLLEVEYKAYLVIYHAAITALKKLQSVKLINNEFGVTTQSDSSLSIQQQKVFDQAFSGYFFNGKKISEKEFTSMFSGKKYSPITNELFWKDAVNLSINALTAKSTEQIYWGLNAATAIFQLQHAASAIILNSTRDTVIALSGLKDLNILSTIWLRANSASGWIYDVMYKQYFKGISTGYKVLADLYAAITKGTLVSWAKFGATVANAVISLTVLELKAVNSFLSVKGIGKNTAGWIVTGIFLAISEYLDSVDQSQKREKLKNKFIEAYRGGYIEGPYVQSGGQIKIKKTKDGKLPVAYDSDMNPISYESVQSETIKNEDYFKIKSYNDLMGPSGSALFWSHLNCEDARVLKSVLDDDRKLYGTYSSKNGNSAPRIADVAPNHFDLGIHTNDRRKTFDLKRSILGGIVKTFEQYDSVFIQEGVPYINAEFIVDFYFETIRTNRPDLIIDRGNDIKAFRFIPNYKYTRQSNSITISDSLSQYFSGKYPTNTEFGIEKLELNIPPYTYLNKIDNPKHATGITNSEKIYLIRKKYGLDLINPNLGNNCCLMSKLINTEDEYKSLQWPNNGITKSDWVDSENLPSSFSKRWSLTRYKERNTNKEIQGCEYLITLSTEEVYQKVIERINECEQGANCFSNDTKVTTPNGYTLIENISVGDVVISFDKNGELYTSKVTKVFHHTETKADLYRYELKDGNYLDLTQNHPVLTEDGLFTEIGNLSIGDFLVDQRGEKVEITKIHFLRKDFTYNISVEPNSTYIANNIRVHNKPVAASNQDTLPVTRYDEAINSLAESFVEVHEINEPEPDLDCQLYGICNDVTCVTCSPTPRFLKICSIPELCLPPKYSNGVPGSMPAWLYSWLQFDYRNAWSSIIRNYSEYYAWWNFKNKPLNVDFQFRPYEMPIREPLDNPLEARGVKARKERRERGNRQTSNTGG